MDDKKEPRGGKRAGAGRKPKYEGGRQQLAISCSIEQKEAIQKAAGLEGVSVAEYVLKKLGVSELATETA